MATGAELFSPQWYFAARAQPKTGEIATGWLSFKVDASTQSRYLLRIEKACAKTLRKFMCSTNNKLKVRQRNLGPRARVILSVKLGCWMNCVSVAAGISNRAASLLGQWWVVPIRSALSLAGEPVILLRLDDERAQATLAHALTQEGMRTWLEEADYGLFYFGYDNPSDEPGLWQKMTFRGA